MASYTALNEHSIQQVLNLYGLELDQTKTIEPMMHGISNSNYSIFTTDGEKRLLKVSNDKTREQLLEEFKILDKLKGSYPYSIAPFLTLENELIYEHKELIGALFPCKKGSTPTINNYSMSQLGKALADLHSISIKTPEVRSYFEIGQGARELIGYLKQKPESEFSQKALEIISLERLNLVQEQNFPSGIIHGDFYYDNALFIDNQLKWVLDFEQAGFGPYILDLGIAISGSCLDQNQFSTELMSHYLSGYQEQRPLSDKELEFLNDFILIGFLSISLWRIKRFVEKNISSDKKESYKELLDLALNTKKALCN